MLKIVLFCATECYCAQINRNVPKMSLNAPVGILIWLRCSFIFIFVLFSKKKTKHVTNQLSWFPF